VHSCSRKSAVKLNSGQIKRNKIKFFAVLAFILAAVFGFVCLTCLRISRTKAASEKLAEAYVSFAQGDRKNGIVLIDETISRFSKTPAAYQARLIKADILIEMHRYGEALKILVETLKNGTPDAVKPLAGSRIIYVYDSKKDYSNAIAASREFIEKYPGHFLTRDIYLNLGEYYFLSGLGDEATEVFNEVSTKFPRTREAEIARGRLEQIKG